jgi:hypothetical protein
MTITDDGRGIANSSDVRRFVAEGHFGLAGMRERGDDWRASGSAVCPGLRYCGDPGSSLLTNLATLVFLLSERLWNLT